MFKVLQTCAVNGSCGGGRVIDKPTEYLLKDINKTDEGWYSRKATNNYGVTLSSGYVTVINTIPLDPLVIVLPAASVIFCVALIICGILIVEKCSNLSLMNL